MKIALIGYGKMGKEIEKIALSRGHEIVSIIDINNQEDFESDAFKSADVAIEFTNPMVAYNNYMKAFKAGVKLVSGSTGWLEEHGEEVIFLRKIVRGGADKSFGVYVARLAGVPHAVVARAQEIEARLEANNINQNTIGKNILEKGKRKNQQQDMFEYGRTELIEELANTDVLSMSPMDALNKLFLLREKARKL